MAKLGEPPVRVGTVGISVHGLLGEAHTGRPGTGRDGLGHDLVDDALAALESDYGLERGFAVREELSLHLERPAAGTRGAASSDDPDEVPRVTIQAPTPKRDEHGQIAIVQDEGVLRFVLPKSDGSFDIAISESTGAPSRGSAQQIGTMLVRVVGLVGGRRAARRASKALAERFEARRRPSRVRSFGPADFSRPLARGATTIDMPSTDSALLLIHGLNTTSDSCFRFTPEYVRTLNARYGERVFAFDHPSLCQSPEENATWLAEHLRHAALANLDILAHSRGGLVARAFLNEKPANVRVRSVVFVGTPNGGTPLADKDAIGQLLSVVTNLVGIIPDNGFTDAIGVAIDALREFVLEGIGSLPGIAAMQAGSPVLTRLNGHQPSETVLRAIASNYEPRSNERTLHRLRGLVVDQIFLGQDNDLLVPTRSAYVRQDEFQVPVDQRLVLKPSFGVNHSTFWTEDAVLDRLDQWLDPAIAVERASAVDPDLTDPSAELDEAMSAGTMDLIREALSLPGSEELGILSDLVGGPLPFTSRGTSATRSPGLVVVLPGIMGSRLAVDGRTIWLGPWDLVRGRFRWLRVGGPGERRVELAGLMRQYAPLLAQLDRSWEVLPFPYDWRRSISDSAAELEALLATERERGKRPIHFVAHSMGGLVVRALFARDEDTWRAAAGRVVQLGTPNAGSFAMPLAVCGEELLVRALALADLPAGKDEVVATIASFPGVFELFPPKARALPEGDRDHEDLYKASRWRKGDADAVQRLLDRATTFHERLADTKVDDRFVYVAGDGHRTPYRARVEANGDVSFGITTRGDGRVPHALGHEGLGFGGTNVYYVGSNHGDLIGDPSVLAVLNDLLLTGQTTLLDTRPKALRGDIAEPEVWVKASELERSLGLPDPAAVRGSASARSREVPIADASSIYIGSTGTPRPAYPPLRVRVVHGSMEQARYPVAAGRYKGIPIEGALGYLDDRFGGALTDLHLARLYPDEAGAGRYLRAPDHVYPVGAILLGLGDFGSLTPDLLARAMERGASDYALAERRLKGGEPILGISAVLVGTPGRYGLTVPASVAATIRGVARASASLGMRGIATIEELEFIEVSENRAEEAAAALERLKDTAELDTMEVPVEVDSAIEARAGGRPGSQGYDESGSPWPRLMLELDHAGDDQPAAPGTYPLPEERLRTLTYVSMGRRAQARDLRVEVSLAQIDRHVRAAIHSPIANEQINNTLFELLLPNEAKLELESLDNLHLLVDETTAFIPWEMIAGRESTGQLSQPLAVRAGLLRQLKPRREEAPRKHLRPVGQEVLVIGDPPTGYEGLPRLPGAQQEARLVADMLRQHRQFNVTECVYGSEDQASAISTQALLDAFFSHHYRMIHIAAHGRFDTVSQNPLRNGVVIGKHDVLGPLQFRQRLVAPDLVFLNCCHIGRIDDPGSTEDASNFSHLAASLAIELMRCGVGAVVAAGWAVNDSAARDFARVFYERMLDGQSFGEAVRAARLEVYYQYKGNNTWAAYQCYGDPDFQFVTATRPRQASSMILSSQHLIKELRALEKKAGDAVSSVHLAGVVEAIRSLETRHVPRFKADTVEMWQALARAYSEAGEFEDAVYCYRQAIELDAKGICGLESRWQLANLEARLAAQVLQPERRSRLVGSSVTRFDVRPADLFRKADAALRQLEHFGQSAELLAIRGSLHKKRASTRKHGSNIQKQDLRRSMLAYQRALAESSRDGPMLNVYHASLALQMEHALHGGTPEQRARQKDVIAALEGQLSMYERGSGDYFERAQQADILATGVIVRSGLRDPDQVGGVVDAFTRAFQVRSTRRQRLSVIDNYWDLHHVLSDEAERHGARAVATALDAFTPANGGVPRTRP